MSDPHPYWVGRQPAPCSMLGGDIDARCYFSLVASQRGCLLARVMSQAQQHDSTHASSRCSTRSCPMQGNP